MTKLEALSDDELDRAYRFWWRTTDGMWRGHELRAEYDRRRRDWREVRVMG